MRPYPSHGAVSTIRSLLRLIARQQKIQVCRPGDGRVEDYKSVSEILTVLVRLDLNEY